MATSSDHITTTSTFHNNHLLFSQPDDLFNSILHPNQHTPPPPLFLSYSNSNSNSSSSEPDSLISKPKPPSPPPPPPQRQLPPKKKLSKRKSRASKRSPTTFIAADPENFRHMVQQVTGVRFHPGPLVKPAPHRPVNRIPAGCLLPTLDTSAFLLDHHQEVVGPTPAPSSAVVGDGYDFDGIGSATGIIPNFPTLESWKVM